MFVSDQKLTQENFLMYAIKVYDNPHCMSMAEFQEDLKKIKYIKRLINRYLKSGELKERLLLNHLIIMINMFGPEHAPRILFFKLEKIYHSVLKTFLQFLNCMPEVVMGLENGDLLNESIPLNKEVAERLQKI